MKDLPDLHTAYRLECKSKKPQKLPADFYLLIFEGLKERDRLAAEALKGNDMENYISQRNQIDFYRRDLESFMEKRLEKVLLMSLYDLKNSEIRFLPKEEELRLAVKELTRKFVSGIGGKLE